MKEQKKLNSSQKKAIKEVFEAFKSHKLKDIEILQSLVYIMVRIMLTVEKNKPHLAEEYYHIFNSSVSSTYLEEKSKLLEVPESTQLN